MKNEYYSKSTRSILGLVVGIFLAFSAKADINMLASTATPGNYTSGGSTLIVFEVSFTSTTLEWADAIEFIGPNGVTLTHGMPSPAPYNFCGGNQGDEGLANAAANGILWTRPGFSLGSSNCGPFQDDEVHLFGINVEALGSVTGPIDITVNVYGDGFGENGQGTFETTTVQLNQLACVINCPDDIVVNNDAGQCGANVNVLLPSTNGGCFIGPTNMSGFYPIGESTVEFTSEDSQGNVSTCEMTVTVNDVEPPTFLNCQDIIVSLDPGECSQIVNYNIQAEDNCEDIEMMLSQNSSNNITTSVACPGGQSQYFRVFDMNAMGVFNDFNLTDVDIGVFNSFNGSFVTVNVYELNGALNYANLTLLGTNTMILPTLNQQIFNVPVAATLPAGATIALEIVAPPSNFIEFVMGMNTDGETNPTYLASNFCGTPQPTTMASIGFPGFAAIMSMNGEQEAVSTELVSGIETGEFFPIGVSPLTVVATDAYGNQSTCNINVIVNEFPDPIGSIACNDNVQVSLDEDCFVVVGADAVLEGGPYGCYDNYTVIIDYPFNTNSYNPPNVVDETHAGRSMIVTVIDEAGNSCWGNIYVEDKIPPPLECEDITTICSAGTSPDNNLASRIVVDVQPETELDPSNVGDVDIVVNVTGRNGATITDLNVGLEISHTWVSDLAVQITSPSGTNARLMIQPGFNFGCAGDDISVIMDDEAAMTQADLDNTCNGIPPAISGEFQPLDPLSAFDGEPLNGEWIITVSDFFFGDGGEVEEIALIFEQTGGTVSLPIPEGATYFTSGNDFIVFNFDACSDVTLSYLDEVNTLNCNSPYSSIITRNWYAVDETGNESTSCVQTIFVERSDLSTLQLPESRDDLSLPSFRLSAGNNCQPSWQTLPNGNPAPVSSGMPLGDFCDNIEVTFEDTKLEICGPGYKLLRAWTIIDWCENEVVEHTQIIKVIDDEEPIIEAPADFTISSDIYSCGGNLVVPPLASIEDCSEVDILVGYKEVEENGDPFTDIIYDDIVILQDGTTIIYNLPFGQSWIVYTVRDECGNESQTYAEVTVIDDIPPVAVCDEYTIVTLGIDGRSLVPAEVFDDGSHDNCEIDYFEVRRLTNTCIGGLQFADKVPFCCEDIGTEVVVEMRVVDKFGNDNICTVQVEVQDELAPILVSCPADVTINCRDDYNDLSLTNGEAVFIDNCGVEVDYVDVVNIDQCGVGTVTRTWIANEINGPLTSGCIQTIYIVNSDPFEENDITWPDADVTLSGANCTFDLDPEVTGRPLVDDDNCSLVGMTYEDQVFDIVPGSCKKVIREWTVIDWCQYDESNPNSNVAVWTYRQVIKIENSVAPEFTISCQDTTICVYEPGCQGFVTLTASATDDCTPEDQLNWSYRVDEFNDGTTDYAFPSNNASRTYPYGTHKLTWIVEDGCGNISECDYLFTVADCKAPTPYCYTSITTVVMDNSGSVAIWASDFDFNSEDNCTPQEDLLLSFSEDVNNTSVTFTCADIPNGEISTIPLQMWVTDEAGNQDYCTVFISLQDNNNDVCDGTMTVTADVGGYIQREDNEMIENVEVRIYSDYAGFPQTWITDENGSFEFEDLPGGINAYIDANKEDDPMNGVSTLDLVLIQKHILGLSTFDSPYKVIAADIDNSQSISAIDLVQLRKLILGVIEDYPNGQSSWRFVDANQNFPDLDDPFPYVEQLIIQNIQNDLMTEDFIGVKIGDVNYSASVNSAVSSTVRNDNIFGFILDDQEVSEGDVVQLSFNSNSDFDLLGYQFTLNFDELTLEYLGFESSSLDLNESNLGLIESADGIITTSWNDIEAQNISENESLFVLTFRAKQAGRLSDLISANSLLTRAEAYDNYGNIYDIELAFRNDNEIISNDVFELYQNVPNPFNTITNISFNLPEDGTVSLNIYDVTGKLLYRKQEVFNAGFNTITINSSEINGSGVMYYQLETENDTATKKMITLD